ncbi:hypothetical protein [Rhizorhabdus wittichii]|uniref:hypothetical protein n=1 Tax=Rhizorhabdus wittichii TaxID=160791 RepID=UPI0002FBA1FB|nr:hypothetical protein [Rhizorhabdus wittichii]
MTENDLQIARDVGELKADMRTVKHDVAGIQQALIGLGEKMNGISNQQARGLGFFAGAAFIVTAFGGLLLALGKMLFGGHGA